MIILSGLTHCAATTFVSLGKTGFMSHKVIPNMNELVTYS